MALPNFVSCKKTVELLIDILENKKFGMYLRFGDGDFNLANGEGDMLANPSVELQELMQESMKINDNSVMICVPNHNRELNTLEEGMYPGNHEYSFESVIKYLKFLQHIRGNIPYNIYTNVALSYCGSHYPHLVVNIHKQIKKYPVIFIGNYKYKIDFLQKLFGNLDIIPTNSRDSFLQFNDVFLELDNLYNNKYKDLEYFVIIMAAGCAGRGFSGKIYNKYKTRNYFVFDYGSLLDFLNNDISRAYMELDPPKADYILSNI
jgi:hypothetical protein